MFQANKISRLVNEVGVARKEYISLLKEVNETKAAIKPSPNEWSIIDNTEHLFWAEQGALYGMWKTLYAIREGKTPRVFESEHKDWPIEKLIAETWKEKEQVPAIATPRLGGTLAFWTHSLLSLQQVLESFGNDLKDDELRLQAHPHPISGAVDFQQRLEFLRFHIQRHHSQVQSIIQKFA